MINNINSNWDNVVAEKDAEVYAKVHNELEQRMQNCVTVSEDLIALKI